MSIVTLVSHLLFITLVNQLLRQLFDWSKLIKVSPENITRLNVFILLLSIAIGYLISHFLIEVIQISQSLFFAFR